MLSGIATTAAAAQTTVPTAPATLLPHSGITLTKAAIEAGRLVVEGTAAPGTEVTLDDARTKAARPNGVFRFVRGYLPVDCTISLTTNAGTDRAVVASCGPKGVNFLGVWSATTDYEIDDLVSFEGSTWRATRTNVNRSPRTGSPLWQMFALRGDRGAKGAAGPKGPAGPQGPQGTSGVNGTAGPAGATGAQGAKGLNWRGAWSATTGYVADDAVQFAGKAYVALQDGTNHDPASEQSFWSLLASGPNWLGTWDGAAAYALNDAVSRGGSSYVAIQASTNQDPATQTGFWSLLAQKGDAGARGDTGLKGDTGAAGAQGPIGPQGAPGATGAAGATGATGAQGPAGPNSVPDGSVTAPSINFASSTSTGIFSPETGKIALAESGAVFLHNIGTDNTAVGTNALVSNTSGYSNTAVGANALVSNTIGQGNTTLGSNALQANTRGGNNTALGWSALQSSTNGGQNTAVGSFALMSNTTGGINTAVGYLALEYITTGNNNTAVGDDTLLNTQTGSNNIAIGSSAGRNSIDPADSVFIGSQGVAGDTAAIRVGEQGTQTSAFIAGIRGVTTGTNDAIPVMIDSSGQLGTVSSSRRYKDDIQPMGDVSAVLDKLRPVTFRYKTPYSDGSKPIQYGLIAEEVAEVFPDLAVFNADGKSETVKYHLLPALLLNEVQRQQKIIQAQAEQAQRQQEIAQRQQRTIQSQAEQVAALEQRLSRVESQMVQPTARASWRHPKAHHTHVANAQKRVAR